MIRFGYVGIVALVGLACFLAGYGMGALALDVDWTRPRRTFRAELDAAQEAGA